jgi:uncharacterized membrane protein (GlpM family)
MSREVWILVIKALVGGTFVVAFALISEALKPKEFAGLLAAAPSVALASLIVTMLDKGPARVQLSSTGMIAGALAMVTYCVLGTYTVRRWRAKLGSLVAAPAWFAVALGVYLVFLA